MELWLAELLLLALVAGIALLSRAQLPQRKKRLLMLLMGIAAALLAVYCVLSLLLVGGIA